MNVTFTGYKNALASSFMKIEPKSNKGEIVHAFSCQVTNDCYGHDLNEYLLKLKRSDTPFHPDLNFINITSCSGDEYKRPDIYLNGVLLEANDKNLGVFSFCTKFLKNVVMKTKNKVANDYFQGEDFDKHLFIGANLREILSKEEYDKLTKEMVDTSVIHSRAEIICSDIQSLMEDYFA